MATHAGRARQYQHNVACVERHRLDTQKKTLGAIEHDELARTAFRHLLATLDARQIVVVDESGTHIGMTPQRGRAPRGQRAFAKTLRNDGTNVSLMASLSLDGIGAAMTIEGAVDGAAFEVYVRHFLAPQLRPGQIVILDNLSAHKGPAVRRLIEARDCMLLFLPAYSPDRSPIEKAFSKLKAVLRRVEAQTMEMLHEAIALGLARIRPSDALSYFLSCGFKPLDQSL